MTERLLMGRKESNQTKTLIVMLNLFSDAGESICKRLVFSGASSAKQLQQFVEANIYHRQGNAFNDK